MITGTNINVKRCIDTHGHNVAVVNAELLFVCFDSIKFQIKRIAGNVDVEGNVE